MSLIKALTAAEAYAACTELGVQLVAARSLDIAGRWVRVEGSRRSFRRTYVVDCSTPNGFVVEIIGGSQMDDIDCIAYALAEIEN